MNLTKQELLAECAKLGLTKYKSKSKNELIILLTSSAINNVSPLRYPGGKTRACKILNEIINNHFDISQFSELISPFFGGGSFEFYLQNKYNLHISANDEFIPLYNFWKQVKYDKNTLCNELRAISSITKEMFNSYRNEIGSLDNLLQCATYYFIINRCSFSGATLSGGFSEEASKKRFTKSSIDRIGSLNLANIDFYNQDFSDFITDKWTETSLMFLDPPYHLDSKLYGYGGDMQNIDHQLLFDILSTKKNWILTYNDCEFIRNMYKDYTTLDVNWKYGMNSNKTSAEIVIIST